MQYYININGVNEGPYSLEEIRSKDISPKTKIWKSGMEKWTVAENLEEIRPHIYSKPPDLRIKENKFDVRYEKRTGAVFAGILLLVVYGVLNQSGILVFESKEEQLQFTRYSSIASLIIRILVTIWIVGVAKEQNRNAALWGFFAFILPSIALISIGLTNKIKDAPMLSIPLDNSNLKDNNTPLDQWRKNNPGKSINDYYSSMRKK